MRLTLALLATMTLSLQAREEAEQWETLEGCRLVRSSINDGDSVLTKYGKEEYVFRLYWVDAPETSETYIGRVREQSSYFSIPEEEVMDTGKLASRFTRNFLSGTFTVHTKWEDARGSGGKKRFFAMIEKDGELLSNQLVAAGLARIYGMPTKDKWPGGVTPRTYLGRLKNSERKAQRDEEGIWALASGSMQMSGLETLIAGSESGSNDVLASDSSTETRQSLKDRININTATAEELDTLPGIGPSLAQRIIGARPIDEVDALVEIPGISANTLLGFSHLIVTEDPPPPPKTVEYYMADSERYMDTEIVVLVERVLPNDAESPGSFQAVTLDTAYEGENGGSITAFIPDEFLESFLQFYSEPGREFTGLLFQRGEETVLVYRRK